MLSQVLRPLSLLSKSLQSGTNDIITAMQHAKAVTADLADLAESPNLHRVEQVYMDIKKRHLVCHVMSDVFAYMRHPSRENLRTIAATIVRRNPTAFVNQINGKLLDDGVSSIMLMLEAKKQNLNQRMVEDPTRRPTKRSLDLESSEQDSCRGQLQKKTKVLKTSSYSCHQWDSDVIEDETDETQEQKRVALIQLVGNS